MASADAAVEQRAEKDEIEGLKNVGMAFASFINEFEGRSRGQKLTWDDPELIPAAAHTAEIIRDASNNVPEMQRTLKANTELFKLNNSVGKETRDKYLSVIQEAQREARSSGNQNPILDYKEVAKAYECKKPYGYTVMEDMAEDVPGVFYSEGRTDLASSSKRSGKHIRIELKHPVLREWISSMEDGLL